MIPFRQTAWRRWPEQFYSHLPHEKFRANISWDDWTLQGQNSDDLANEPNVETAAGRLESFGLESFGRESTSLAVPVRTSALSYRSPSIGMNENRANLPGCDGSVSTARSSRSPSFGLELFNQLYLRSSRDTFGQ